jgi:hypothetical protein
MLRRFVVLLLLPAILLTPGTCVCGMSHPCSPSATSDEHEHATSEESGDEIDRTHIEDNDRCEQDGQDDDHHSPPNQTPARHAPTCPASQPSDSTMQSTPDIDPLFSPALCESALQRIPLQPPCPTPASPQQFLPRPGPLYLMLRALLI